MGKKEEVKAIEGSSLLTKSILVSKKEGKDKDENELE
jgi:hypothetical protein